ncbi:MAG: hypothetical protein C4570_02460 [Ammonifex sp.]|jgi:hypothetical protein|nr:MAG: hypothetical protein C4570_02460 [Ammonifex sp.]
MKYPFEVAFPEVQTNLDPFVTAIFSCLESEFLVLPKGDGFIDYPVFEQGYESLKQATNGFRNTNIGSVINAVFETPMVLIVLRTMLGFTPPEWAYIATQRTGIDVSQGFIRSLDRGIRMAPFVPLRHSDVTLKRVKALVETACQLLVSTVPEVGAEKIHRLDKADTRNGSDSIRAVSGMGVPYAMLLYERFLGRPFAGHRDSVSELVGNSLESAVEDVLVKAGISYRKTKRAERISGFDQAPDFIIPSEFNPQIIIEAKLTEDDGTARDKATRIQHLAELSLIGRPKDSPKFEVIACIAGRGFGVRREDMKKLLLATRGKVFTLKTMDRLVEFTRLREFKTKE